MSPEHFVKHYAKGDYKEINTQITYVKDHNDWLHIPIYRYEYMYMNIEYHNMHSAHRKPVGLFSII